jgi:alkylation response protein AidB-like acyl-CoA dehydrogenase
MLGADGKGFDIMMGIVLPPVQYPPERRLLVGLMNAATANTAEHASRTRHSDTGSSSRTCPIRNYIARMRIKTDMAVRAPDDTVAAVQANRPDAMLRVLECKACAGETANEVLDLAMRVCGGAAFRKDVGVGAASAMRGPPESWPRPPTFWHDFG